jgi:hypothetical protein
MNLVLPTVSSTVGPDWADQLNAAFALVDSHDHSTGEGVPITPAGMNISSNLTFNNFYATSVGSLRLTNQSATLSTPSDVRAVYSVNGDLYYNNSAGAAIQITSGGSVIAASDGIARSFSRTAVSSNTIISAAATVSYYDVDTTTSVTFTLPAANAVSAGRFYEFKDTTGQAATNNIVINRAGADTIDGATSFTISSNYGQTRLTSDGVSKWAVFRVGTSNIIDSAVTTAKINDGAVTQAKRAALGQQYQTTVSDAPTLTSTSFADIANATITITTTGRPVFIVFQPEIAGIGGDPVGGITAQASSNNFDARIRFLRGATSIFSTKFSMQAVGATAVNFDLPASCLLYIDVPAAGTYTYKVQYKVGSGTNFEINYCKLMVFEL